MRFWFPAPVLGAVLATVSAGQANVLVIIADDLGVDNIGAYGVGADLPATPNIDALAASGVLFRNAHAHPLCVPSRISIQTGLYPFRTGVGAHMTAGGYGVPLEHMMLPEALDAMDLGYSHALFGKWHLSNDTTGGIAGPNLSGYDHFAGVMGNLGVKQDAYFTWQKVVDGVQSTVQGYLTTDTVDDAVTWMREAPSPWFACVAFNAPHAPMHAPPAHLHGVDLSSAGPPSLDPRPYYKAMIEAMDTEIDRLIAAAGPPSTRTIVFLGDNGTPDAVTAPPFVPSHAKGTAYQGGVQVPLIVSGPIVAAPGREHDGLVTVADLFATVVELADRARRPPKATRASAQAPVRGLLSLVDEPVGLERASDALPHAADSRSLVPVLESAQADLGPRLVFSEMFLPNGVPTPTILRRQIRDERYKLMVNLGGWDPPLPEGMFFFDLQSDPFETVNLLDQPALTPEEAAALRGLSAELLILLAS